MKKLEEAIGRGFAEPALLRTALTHSSFANEKRGGTACNERLEFLGDSILGMLVAEHLYKTFPELPEGDMTRLRAELVCEESLHAVALRLGLGEFLLLGRGEEHGGGRERPSILADAVEAVLAAVYLDGGDAAARSFVDKFILSKLKDGKSAAKDYKTALQELIQRSAENRLEYKMTGESGPDHDKTFEAEVLLNGERVGTGSGRSKKEAEQSAARAALESGKL